MGIRVSNREDDFTVGQMQNASDPIASLIGKSEKSLGKLSPKTWQYSMLQENLKALYIASDLINKHNHRTDVLTLDDMREALRAIKSMIGRTDATEGKFPPGTAQYTLLKNRLTSLRAAETLMTSELNRRVSANGDLMH